MSTHSTLKDTVTAVTSKLAHSAKALDVKEFESLLHDDFIDVDMEGKTHSKQETLDRWRKQDLKASSVHVENVHVRQFGDTVISTGIAAVEATYKGHDITDKYRFTHIFAHRNGDKLTAGTKGQDLVLTHCTATKVA